MLFGLRFVSDNPIHCVIMITIAMGFNGATTVVNLANNLDLAPNYAATLSAIINTFATSGGIIAPVVVTYFTREHVSFFFFITEFNQIEKFFTIFNLSFKMNPKTRFFFSLYQTKNLIILLILLEYSQ